jgi:NADH-quinone oxidoreductase subunit M
MIFLPVLTALIIMMYKDNTEIPKKLALFTSLVLLGMGIFAYMGFDGSNPDFQYVEKLAWFPEMGINYYLGTDGISFPLILLTLILTPLVVYFSWEQKKRPALYFALFMLIEAGVIGFFQVWILYYFLYLGDSTYSDVFCNMHWGGERKEYASFKFLIYTHIASLVLLIGIFAMYFHGGEILGYRTFSIPELTNAAFSVDFQMFCSSTVSCFAVKIPIVPSTHGFLMLTLRHLRAEVQACWSFTKMGTYGMLRVAF